MIMSKDKRGFGERSTNEAPIAPKLRKRLDRCRAVRSEYIKGKKERLDMCIHVRLPKASIDLVLIGLHPSQKRCCESVVLNVH